MILRSFLILEIAPMPPATTMEHWQIITWVLLIIVSLSLLLNARFLWEKKDEQKKTNEILLKYVQQNTHIIQNINDRVVILEKYHKKHYPEEECPIKPIEFPKDFGVTA